MKKFISMTMAAIMAASIVPSTAFAADEEIAKIKTVGAIEWNTEKAKTKPEIDGVELQIKLKDFYQSYQSANEKFELTLETNGASVANDTSSFTDLIDLTSSGSGVYRDGTLIGKVFVEPYELEDTTFDFVIQENGYNFVEDDKIVIIINDMKMDRYSEGAKATIDVTGDFGEASDLLVAAIYGNSFKVDYSKKLTEIAVESEKTLNTITIESKVGKFSDKEEIKVKINSDFEISKFEASMIEGGTYKDGSLKDNKEFVIIPSDGSEEITIKGLEIESLDGAKPGDIAKFEVKCKGYDAAYVEVAKVVADEVTITVDEDEDVPVMYSGTDIVDTGLDTDNKNHKALAVTIEEVTVDSWDEKDAWTLILPEGVYVSNIENADMKFENMSFTGYPSGPMEMFKDAYKKGDFEAFEFGRRSFTVDKDKKATLEFTFELIAEPGFEGPVELTFDNGEFKDSVVIAKFVSPYKVEAKQNDVKIDYRYTKLDSNIVITEVEEDLWKDTEFKFEVDHMSFEDTTKYDANFDVKELKSLKNDELGFKITEQSDEEPFKVVISDMSLYMDRNLPAGGYDLIMNTTMSDAFMDAALFGSTKSIGEELFNGADEFDVVAKEDFVNVITGDADTFVTKVEVPVGKDYIKAGDKVFTLDVPAYINTDNYTMLPVRAVAIALGIDNDAIIWNAETHTATIFHGSRIISMTVGADVMTVNGTTIPTATSVKVVNGRMFIPMRDLATAMNAKLDWDAATKTAYFN